MKKRKGAAEQRRNKFHEALLSLYHPPSPQQSQKEEHLYEEVPSSTAFESDTNVDAEPDVDHTEKENNQSDASDGTPKKLSRSQRKRIRKRKLKEAALVRRQIIGPLLPGSYEDQRHGNSNNEVHEIQEKLE